jgi:heptosyltransferase-2
MHVALIKTAALGDVVRTTALVPGLLRLDPSLSLTWITAPGALDLLSHHPHIHRAVSIDDPPDAVWRTEAYDWIISLDDGPRECRLASDLAASGARLSGAFEAPDGHLVYTPDVESWFGMGILRPEEQGGLARANVLKARNTKTVAALLYDGLGLPGPVGRPLVPVPEADARPASAWLASVGLADRRPLVGLNTGAGGRWRFKSWGEDQSSELARRLLDEAGASAVLVLGGPAEQARNARIISAADHPSVISAPTDLPLLAFTALLGRLDLLVTSDSLALHLAVSQDVPVVSFFGPTSASEIELYSRGSKVVTPLECRCCYLKDCDVRPHCMQTIDVEMMLSAARRWLPA